MPVRDVPCGMAFDRISRDPAVMAGVLYSWGGRTLAFTTCSVLMLVLVSGAYLLAGPEYRSRRGIDPVSLRRERATNLPA